MTAAILALVLSAAAPLEGSRSWCETVAATDSEVEFCAAAYPSLAAEWRREIEGVETEAACKAECKGQYHETCEASCEDWRWSR